MRMREAEQPRQVDLIRKPRLCLKSQAATVQPVRQGVTVSVVVIGLGEHIKQDWRTWEICRLPRKEVSLRQGLESQGQGDESAEVGPLHSSGETCESRRSEGSGSLNNGGDETCRVLEIRSAWNVSQDP